ncbi:MAG: hypothetical protein K8F91_23555 [Candidatus Obscuribacterales bacterium]|nr:hypothetical protein [Candidatus Obscuribacterales bacterium]
MNPKAFLFRTIAMVVLFLTSSLMGIISVSWWASMLTGLGTSLAFTFVSERILRGLLMGKIGNGPIAWYSVQLFCETLALAAMAFLISSFGVRFAIGWPGIVMATIVWATLCQEMLRKLPGMIITYFLIRGSR